MADKNPYDKPAKNETKAQRDARVAKFYSYQRKQTQAAAAKGDMAAADRLMSIGRKAEKGGKSREGKALQQEGARRKMGQNVDEANARNAGSMPGTMKSRLAGAIPSAALGGIGGILGKALGKPAMQAASRVAGPAMKAGMKALGRGLPVARPVGQKAAQAISSAKMLPARKSLSSAKAISSRRALPPAKNVTTSVKNTQRALTSKGSQPSKETTASKQTPARQPAARKRQVTGKKPDRGDFKNEPVVRAGKTREGGSYKSTQAIIPKKKSGSATFKAPKSGSTTPSRGKDRVKKVVSKKPGK